SRFCRNARGRSRYYARICAVSTSPRRTAKSMRRKTPTRIDQMLTLAVLALLIVGCFLVLQPFITAVVWAAILCVTSWPLFSRLRTRFRRHDWLAALLMLLLITVALFAPFVVVGATIADNAEAMAAWTRDLLSQGPPEPPAWVAEFPLVGERLAAYWSGMAHDTPRLLAGLRQ